MRKHEVPQDEALLDGLKEVCYAVDDSGRYVLAQTSGWEPANIANVQAWEAIEGEVASVLARVHAGRLSPLAFHMARHQMNARLLAGYAGLFAWQVRRHMKPGPFRRLSAARLERYADILRMTPEALRAVPGPPAVTPPGGPP
jgi:hypothetical protein